jgi:RimJ/RimL family protein N-acetyltransferase
MYLTVFLLCLAFSLCLIPKIVLAAAGDTGKKDVGDEKPKVVRLVTVEPYGKDDAALYKRLVADAMEEKGAKFIGPSVFSNEQMTLFHRCLQAATVEGTSIPPCFHIYVGEKVVGRIFLFPHILMEVVDSGRIEFTRHLLKEERGKGYGTLATMALLEWTNKNVGKEYTLFHIRRPDEPFSGYDEAGVMAMLTEKRRVIKFTGIYSTVNPNNISSLKTHEKAGTFPYCFAKDGDPSETFTEDALCFFYPCLANEGRPLFDKEAGHAYLRSLLEEPGERIETPDGLSDSDTESEEDLAQDEDLESPKRISTATEEPD